MMLFQNKRILKILDNKYTPSTTDDLETTAIGKSGAGRFITTERAIEHAILGVAIK